MPASLQAKLLRVLEDGEITPVGATQARRVDVRVISATNADLAAKIASSDFRQDLYFRLARFIVRTPPLREHPEDVPLLCAHFLQFFAEEMGMAPPALCARGAGLALDLCLPGQRARTQESHRTGAHRQRGTDHRTQNTCRFPRRPWQAPYVPGRESRATAESAASLPLNLEEAENALIQRALEQTRGNVAEAARLLGVNRSRIYRRFPQSAES